jgi:hypothetical protein
MNYVKGILSGLAAIFLAEFVPGPWSMFKGISEQKATGLGVAAAGIMGSAFSPLFWTLALLFFALLYAASRLGNKILRVILFWTRQGGCQCCIPAIEQSNCRKNLTIEKSCAIEVQLVHAKDGVAR